MANKKKRKRHLKKSFKRIRKEKEKQLDAAFRNIFVKSGFLK